MLSLIAGQSRSGEGVGVRLPIKMSWRALGIYLPTSRIISRDPWVLARYVEHSRDKSMNARRMLLEASYALLDRSSILAGMNLWRNHAKILMFHRVNDYDKDPLTTPTSIFDEMIRELKEQYQIVSLGHLVASIIGCHRLNGEVAVTFDDGYRDNLSCAAPVLKKYGVPATFFVTSGYINTDKVFPWDMTNPIANPPMTWSEVRELDKLGFEIGAHTMTHADLGAVTLEEARREIRLGKQEIESELGKEIGAFAFPFGRRENCKPEVSRIVMEEGFTCCCLGFGGKVTAGSDVFSLNRIPAYPTTIEMQMELDDFVTYFDGETRVRGLPLRFGRKRT